MQIGNAITAVRAGWVLKNPATWKNRTLAVNAIAGLLGVAIAIAKGFGYDIPATDEMLAGVGAGVWALVGLFNAWSTAATSDKVGLPPRADPGATDSAGPVDPGSGA